MAKKKKAEKKKTVEQVLEEHRKKAGIVKTAKKRAPAKKRARKRVEKKVEKKAKKKATIRSTAEALLMDPALSYPEVLKRVLAKHDGAKTSYACLRWYASQMRLDGRHPPERPTPAKRKEG